MKNSTLCKSLLLTFASMVIIGLIFIAPGTAKIDPNSVVALWLFNEGKGEVAEDSSGNGNNGKFAGAANIKWVEAKYGRGLEFDGKSWLECGKGESLDFKASTTFSIHSIVKATGSPTGKCIIWKGLGCSTWSQWLLGTGAHENGDNATNAAFHFRTGNSDAKIEVRSKDPLPENTWVQVCGTYDGTKLKLYINGQLSSENAAKGNPWASAEQVYIGADPGCSNRCQWVGIIDEIAIFNVTLSDDEVKALSNGYEGAMAVSDAGKLATLWGNIKSK